MAEKPENPKSKVLEYEITPEGGDIEVKGAKLSLFPRSVTEVTKVSLSLSVTSSSTPDNHVRASATLRCQPPINFKKYVHVRIPTWYASDKSVDLGIYEEQTDSTLKEIDSVILTDERFIDLQVKSLSNIAAFLLKDRLQDVEVAIRPFLYHNNGGKVATGFKLSDKVFEEELQEKFQDDRMWAMTRKIKEATVSIRDTLEYCLHSKDEVSDSSRRDEVKGQVTVDEAFLQNIEGHVSFGNLKSTPFGAMYDVTHLRSTGGQRVVVGENNYEIVVHGGGGSVDFLGSVHADNVISNVGDVFIDQRTELDDSNGQKRRKQHKDNISYEKRSVQVGSVGNSVPTRQIPFGFGGPGARVMFHGNVRCKNMIGNADTVTIDQRKVHKKPERAGPPPRQPVQAEEDVPLSTEQVGYGEAADGDSGACSFNARQPVEGKSESSRAFISQEKRTGKPDEAADEETMEITTHHES